jgi:hypothetical protein
MTTTFNNSCAHTGNPSDFSSQTCARSFGKKNHEQLQEVQEPTENHHNAEPSLAGFAARL